MNRRWYNYKRHFNRRYNPYFQFNKRFADYSPLRRFGMFLSCTLGGIFELVSILILLAVIVGIPIGIPICLYLNYKGLCPAFEENIVALLVITYLGGCLFSCWALNCHGVTLWLFWFPLMVVLTPVLGVLLRLLWMKAFPSFY